MVRAGRALTGDLMPPPSSPAGTTGRHGTGGAAVQKRNILLGLDETTGLV